MYPSKRQTGVGKLEMKVILRAQNVLHYKRVMNKPGWVYAFDMSVNGQEMLRDYWWSLDFDWLDLIEYERKCASNVKSNQ